METQTWAVGAPRRARPSDYGLRATTVARQRHRADRRARRPRRAAQVYDQVEFLGNPLVSEVTIVKANHDAYNKTQPYNTATFRPADRGVRHRRAGRPQELAATARRACCIPTSSSSTARRTRARPAGCRGRSANGWGGRKLTDDVVDVGLTAIFSSFLNADERDCAPFQLPLCTDNVGANDKAFSRPFPYLAAPTADDARTTLDRRAFSSGGRVSAG